MRLVEVMLLLLLLLVLLLLLLPPPLCCKGILFTHVSGYVVLGRLQPSELMRAVFQDNSDYIIDLTKAFAPTLPGGESEPVAVEYRNSGSVYNSLECFSNPVTFTFSISPSSAILQSVFGSLPLPSFTATLVNGRGDRRSRCECDAGSPVYRAVMNHLRWHGRRDFFCSPHGPFKLDEKVVWNDQLPAPGLYAMQVSACAMGGASEQVVASIPVRIVPSRSQASCTSHVEGHTSRITSHTSHATRHTLRHSRTHGMPNALMKRVSH
jgi:hypothetical protein